MNGVRRTVTTRGESEKKPRGRDTTRLGKTRERCGEDTIRAVSLPTVPSSPRRLLSSSPRFLRTGGKEKRRISDERRRDDEGRDGPRVVHSCLRHFRSLTRPFPPSLRVFPSTSRYAHASLTSHLSRLIPLLLTAFASASFTSRSRM